MVDTADLIPRRPKIVTRGLMGRPVAVGMLAVWCAIAIAIVAIDRFLAGSNIWVRIGVKYDPGPWCEFERSENFLREPANAFSDLAFLAVGLYQIGCAIEDWITSAEYVTIIFVRLCQTDERRDLTLRFVLSAA